MYVDGICSCGSTQCDGCADCELCGARVLADELPDDGREICRKCQKFYASGGVDSDTLGDCALPGLGIQVETKGQGAAPHSRCNSGTLAPSSPVNPHGQGQSVRGCPPTPKQIVAEMRDALGEPMFVANCIELLAD